MKGNNIYILYESYTPNTAQTNRALAYLRSLEKMHMPVQVVFFLPDCKKSKLSDEFQYVKVKYCWEKYFINHKVLKYLSYYYYVKRLLNQLSHGDKVYIYGLNDIKGYFIARKDIEVYYEETECPEASLPGSWLHHPSLEEHLGQCRQLQGLIVISQQLKEYFISKGVSEDKIHIVNMTVDSNRFNGLVKQDVEERYVAYCGTASNNKDGVDKLIRAFGIVNKAFPDLKLYIIGRLPSTDDQSGNLRLIESLGIKDKVVFTGVVNAEQMPQLLKNAEMLALARPDNTQAKYGFPTKLGEYLLTGNPVVVTSVGDIPRYLTDGVSAMIAAPDDDESFAKKMIWVLEHPQEAAKIGECGKGVAMKNFNAEIETKKLAEVLMINSSN